MDNESMHLAALKLVLAARIITMEILDRSLCDHNIRSFPR